MAYDMVFETVPRLNRRIGDNMIAGANNATVLLGRDRVDTVASGHGIGPGSGAIHLIVGRKGEDPSPNEDSATVYMSAKNDPDALVGTDSFGDVRRGVSAVVLRADCVRASARTDFKLSVGKAYLLVTADGTVVLEGDVSLGSGAAQRIIRGDLFSLLFNSHAHPTPMGISGPPAQLMTDSLLSPRNKVT